MLSKFLRDLDQLTTDEKLEIIQYLTTSLIEKRNDQISPEPKTTKAQSPSIIPQDLPKSQSESNVQKTQLLPATQVNRSDNSKKKRAERKTYSPECVSETSPDGKHMTVYIPSLEQITDCTRQECESMAEKKGDPSLANFDTVFGLASFLHVAAKIEAKAIIRKEFTGSEYPEKRELEHKKPKKNSKQAKNNNVDKKISK